MALPDLSKMKDEDYKLLTPEQLARYNMTMPVIDYENQYSHQDYPRAKYRIVTVDGKRRMQSTVVRDLEAERQLGPEWVESPTALGVETHPGAPEIAVSSDFEIDLPADKIDATVPVAAEAATEPLSRKEKHATTRA